ncbi:uncharacterized protein PHACADRAFT_57743, partial [Phanerochaete carnosa HHB-10118-sp]
GADHNSSINQSDWAERVRKAVLFADKDPEVLIVGGDQAGLQTTARLKQHKDIHLIIEKNARIGD